MIVLHGTWLSTEYGGPQSGTFFLWGEDSERPAPAKRRGRRPKISPHPFTAAAVTISGALTALDVSTDLGDKPVQAQVLLPSRGANPLPSPELLREPEASRARLRLATWQVTGYTLPPEDALRLLAALPDPQRTPPHVALGSDLRFWRLAGRFQLSLLARQRFVPGLIASTTQAAPQKKPGRRSTSPYRAAWQPWLDDPADRQRLDELVRNMPPLCRAVQVPGQKEAAGSAPGPRALLGDFLQTATDALVRQWSAQQRRRGGRQPTRAALRWRNALLAESPVLDSDAGNLQGLAQQIGQWLMQLQSEAGAACRLCFRLEPPQEPVASPEARDWVLRYLLQATDDLSLLVPAQQVWRARGSTLRYLDRRFEQPQEQLLAGLGKASRIFPPVEDSLHTARPEAAALTTNEAYTFLRETSLLLEESGFGVLVPQWWGRRGAANRLGARLKLAGKQQQQKAPEGGVGNLTFERIVSVDWELALGDQPISREELERLAQLKMPLVQIRGQWAALDPEQIEAAIRFWEQRQKEAEELSLQEALQMLLGQQEEHAGVALAGVEADGWLADLLTTLRSEAAALAELPQPAGFRGQLRPYQQRGFSWLAFLRRWGFGACLADDMGLGKTIQAIALLLHERHQNGHGGLNPALLICPTSVVGNWQREVQRFAPSLRVMVHHGADRLRGYEFEEAARQHDMVITSYALARRDAELLQTVDWSDVILDEAQNIKNPSAKQTQAIRKLPAQFRVALTGTPVENRLSELWSIMHFLNPGYLGSQRKFRQEFGKPIERAGDEEAATRLRSLTQPFILRRLKTDPKIIQDLPDKLEMTVYCTLTPEQATLYEAVVQDSIRQIEELDGMERRGLVLATLLKLKQVCNHPAQFLADGSPLMQQSPDGPEHRSGKLARLTEMLEEVLAEGDQALIFTQFAEMGEMLKQHLQESFGREVLFLHGGTPLKKRDEMVARFQSGTRGRAPLFILSLKAGGTGLNLTAANHVFHYDRWWNPAVENQATDRAFRIGQKRNVQVHKFVTAGTLEEAIDDLIERKKALAEAVVGTGEGWLTELSTEELREILTLRKSTLN